MTLLEVCVDSLAGLERAVAGGAGRIEACSRLDVGGLSPSRELLAACVASGLPVAAMARPRAGGFVHGTAEIAAIAEEAAALRELGVEAVVLGAVTREREVDVAALERWISAARPLRVVFHRAFDEIADRGAALETLIELGVDRVLTSGGAASAIEGLAELRRLHALARGRIRIVPAGGVRAWNWREVAAAVGGAEIHSSTPFDVRAG